jgi:rubrerythrin
MDAVTKAIEMKKNAIKFYQNSAEKCDHPAGKQMFLVILEDEKHHLESLHQMVNDMHIDMKNLTPIDNIKTSLETLQDQMRARTACSLDEMEVFKIAMDMEKEFVDYYQKHAAEANNDKEKLLFEKLAKEEEEHYRVFSNTHSYLDDTGNWFMWEDHSIVEG